jgi:hypothetical protein
MFRRTSIAQKYSLSTDVYTQLLALHQFRKQLQLKPKELRLRSKEGEKRGKTKDAWKTKNGNMRTAVIQKEDRQ